MLVLTMTLLLHPIKANIDWQLSYDCTSLQTNQWTNTGSLGSTYNIESLTGTSMDDNFLPALCFSSSQTDITLINYDINSNINPELTMEIWIKPTAIPEVTTCLSGANSGCNDPALQTESACLSSKDGRSQFPTDGNGLRIYNEPCVWCGGLSCTVGNPNSCEPKDWLLGQPNQINTNLYTIATCPVILLGHDNGGWDRGIVLYDAAQYGGLAVGVGSPYTSTISYPTTNEWTQIVVTYSKALGQAVVYKHSGSVYQEMQQVSIVGDSGSTETQIGLNGLNLANNFEFIGCIAQVQIINRVLSAAEVGTLYGRFDQVTTTGCDTLSPSMDPTNDPTSNPTSNPSESPSMEPTANPTSEPTLEPTTEPTIEPTTPTGTPSESPSMPSRHPTSDPTSEPTIDPTNDPTMEPTMDPTAVPTSEPTVDPTGDPSFDPTIDPTSDPTMLPTGYPTTEPTSDPTIDPTADPTFDPTIEPTDYATKSPSADPTFYPTTEPTKDPTLDPTKFPTSDPTGDPSAEPTSDPITSSPSNAPTAEPTLDPINEPTVDPTSDPSIEPTSDPTIDPTNDPTFYPTFEPTKDPTEDPTQDPTIDPTEEPTFDPTAEPTTEPTNYPSTEEPSENPTSDPTSTYQPNITIEWSHQILKYYLPDPYQRFTISVKIRVHDPLEALRINQFCQDCFIWQYKDLQSTSKEWIDIKFDSNSQISVAITKNYEKDIITNRLTMQSGRRYNGGRCGDPSDDDRIFQPQHQYYLRLAVTSANNEYIFSDLEPVNITTNSLPTVTDCKVVSISNLQPTQPYNISCNIASQPNLEYNALIQDVRLNQNYVNDPTLLSSYAPVGNVTITVLVRDASVPHSIGCSSFIATFPTIHSSNHVDTLESIDNVIENVSLASEPDIAVALFIIINSLYENNIISQKEASDRVQILAKNTQKSSLFRLAFPSEYPTQEPSADPTVAPTVDPTYAQNIDPNGWQLSYKCNSLENDQWTNTGSFGDSMIYNIGSFTGTSMDDNFLPALCFDSTQTNITFINYDINSNVNPELTMEIWLKPSAELESSCLSAPEPGIGCDAIQTQSECLSSKDGRANAPTVGGYRVYDEPCVWCGGGPCTLGSTNVCEPKDWLLNQPNQVNTNLYTIASCSTWLMGHDDGGWDRSIIAYDEDYGGIAVGVGVEYASTISYPEANEWSQIIATFSKSTGEAVVYKHSANVYQAIQQVNIVDDSGSIETQIGLNGLNLFDNHAFVGCISQVQLTNRVVNATEIGMLYEQFDQVTVGNEFVVMFTGSRSENMYSLFAEVTANRR